MEKGALEKNGYGKVLQNSLRRKQGELDQVRRELWRGVKVRLHAQIANIWVSKKRFNPGESTMKEL